MTRGHVLRFKVKKGLLLMLAASALGAALVSGASAHAGKAAKPAFDVYVDLSTLDAVRTDGTGPFYVQGPVYPEGTLDGTQTAAPPNPIGLFRCWGQFIADPSNPNNNGVLHSVNQIFEFSDGSRIMNQGVEITTQPPIADLAVTGGIGKYEGARGDVSSPLLGFAGNDGQGNPTSVQFRFNFHFVDGHE
jgi:hypothetical protein